MRSSWKEEVSFGLVNVPFKVYSAMEDHDLKKAPAKKAAAKKSNSDSSKSASSTAKKAA